jgi:protein kinase C substrate 80K-H
MLGLCFEMQLQQYTYSMCPYGKAEQREGSSTSLGNWAGMEVGEDGTRVMKFTGGATCWQGGPTLDATLY